LAAAGARGLTHLRVDRQAGFADGTTSFYYQTRNALVRATIDRVIELDVSEFKAAFDVARTGQNSLLSQLAEQALRTAVEPERTRARARFELMMIAAREPELSDMFDGLMEQFESISEAAVLQLHPADTPVDPELIKEQAFAVVTFLGGFLFRLAYGLTHLDSAASLERHLRSLLVGVAAEHSGASDDRAGESR
jgi:hypothetical protein